VFVACSVIPTQAGMTVAGDLFVETLKPVRFSLKTGVFWWFGTVFLIPNSGSYQNNPIKKRQDFVKVLAFLF
jgi:hypothetical protein